MSDDGIFVFNPLPWDRELSGLVAEHVVEPRGVPDDETAGRHFQDRDLQRRPISGFARDEDMLTAFSADAYYLPSTPVKGYGWAVVPRDRLDPLDESSFTERSTVETERYVVTFDRQRGGISSWYDKTRDCEWVDTDADHSLASFVYETVADEHAERPRQRLFSYDENVEDWHAAVAGILDAPRGFRPDWYADRSGAESVVQHRVYDTPEGYEVHQVLSTPQIAGDVTLKVQVPEEGTTIVVDAQWEMGLNDHPEATYLAFPFNLEDPTPRLDVGGQAMEPGPDQLSKSVYDYYTVQQWADLSSETRGMTVGCPLNPMVQFGDFHFADDQRSFELDRPLLLGWITNNYWDTNFRAHQPGRVRAQYHLSPHDKFDEAAAHRVGLEATHDLPLAQTLGEGTVDEPPLTGDGQFLDLPEPPVLVTQVRPVTADTGVFHPSVDATSERDDRMLVSLRNASDEAQVTTITPGELFIEAAERTDPTGQVVHNTLSVDDGGVEVTLQARETGTICLETALND